MDTLSTIYRAMVTRITEPWEGTSLSLVVDLGLAIAPRTMTSSLREMAPDLTRMGWLVRAIRKGSMMVWELIPPGYEPPPPPPPPVYGEPPPWAAG